ncbi:MAG: accessory factor UbiK family protein [Alphaproteobacteria bacterium]|nr:accessory factor UbiK family protein [Alphaproteobacteria bacterium]
MKDKIIDDIAGMMGGALGLLADVRDQVRGDMHDRLKGVADRIDLVTRDEMQALEARIAALEAKLAAKQPAAAPAPKATKTAANKPAPKAKAKKKAKR